MDLERMYLARHVERGLKCLTPAVSLVRMRSEPALAGLQVSIQKVVLDDLYAGIPPRLDQRILIVREKTQKLNVGEAGVAGGLKMVEEGEVAKPKGQIRFKLEHNVISISG